MKRPNSSFFLSHFPPFPFFLSSLVLSSLLLPVACLLAPALAADSPPQFTSHNPDETRYPDRAHCGVNLIEIAKRLHAFTLAADGKLPDRLSAVFPPDDQSAQSLGCLVCPAAPPAVAEGGFCPSYTYVRLAPGARTDKDGGEDFVVFDAAPAHENGRNVLLSDLATVRYLAEPDFQKQLAEQRARWEKQNRRLELVTQDFFPLTDTERRQLFHSKPSLVDSVHFRLVIVLALALVIVLILLLRLRARASSPPQP